MIYFYDTRLVLLFDIVHDDQWGDCFQPMKKRRILTLLNEVNKLTELL